MCHRDVAPGTLLIEESPFVTWPRSTGEELLNEYVIKILLKNKASKQVYYLLIIY